MTAQEVPPVPDTAHSASDEVVSSVPDGPGSPEVPDEESAEHSYEPLNRLLSETTSSTVVSDGASTAVVGAANMTCGHFVGAVANLCSATLGAGILALPFAMYESGLVFGVFLLLASGWATAASIDLIVQACDFYGLKTYESVVEQALGLKWRQTVEISILIFCGGTAVAYVIAVGDIMERLGDGINDTHKRLAMSLVWLLAMLPLSCLRKIQSLQCASSVGIVSIGTLLVAATVHLFLPSEYKPDGGFLGMQDLELFLWPHHGFISILRACPIFFFAYSCQVNVAQIYDELPGPRVAAGASSAENEETNRGRVRSMSWVTWVAIGLCTTLYASISYVTLMDFGDQVEPNILSCYRLSGRESTLLHLAFLAMALAVIMAFPLNVFPARVSIIQMWEAACAKHSGEPMLICVNDEEARQPLISKPGTTSTYNKSSGNNEAQMERGYEFDPLEPPRTPTPLLSQQSTLGDELQLAPGEEYEEPEFHARQHQFVTLLVAGSALGLALVVPNISVVFGLLGGTTSSLLGFVVPGMLGLAMDGPNKASSWTLIVAGTLVGVVTTGVTVYSTIREAF